LITKIVIEIKKYNVAKLFFIKINYYDFGYQRRLITKISYLGINYLNEFVYKLVFNQLVTNYKFFIYK